MSSSESTRDAASEADAGDADGGAAALEGPAVVGPSSRPSDGGLSVDRPFHELFERRARAVRRRLALRYVIAGTVGGLALAPVAAALAWWQRLGELRPWAGLLALAGLALGALVARARRWSDPHVALYLDRTLGGAEAVATALELEAKGTADAAGGVGSAVASRAVEALSPAPPRTAWPRSWRPWHLVGPVAGGVLVWISLAALPPLPVPPPPPPGSELVQVEKLAELDAVVKLAELDARDDAQRKRLDDLSRRAKELQRKLAEGMPRREAQDEIARLREAVAAERAHLGAGEEREGLESAVSKLGKNADLREAQRALGDRDLTRFDEEMAKLANRLEQQDREQARKALEEAAEAARQKGAPAVAKALEEQGKLLEERSRRAERVRELAKALGDGLSPEAQEALRNLEQRGGEQDLADLGDALGDALDQLTEEERKKLAEKLKQQASELDPNTSDAAPADKEQMESLRKQLETEEGRKQLAEQLRRMAQEGGPEGKEPQREQGLGEAEKGLGDAQKQLGAPMPLECNGGGQGDGAGQKPGSGNKPGAGGPGSKPGDAQNGSNGHGSGQSGGGKDSSGGTPGHSSGGGPGEHGGSTSPVQTDPLRSRANTAVNPGSPMPGTVLGRAANPGGETANDVGTGQLGSVAPTEVGAVERNEIPREYREQVGRYFQPD